MAATLVNTLYPPTIDTFQDAFAYTDAAQVYFSLSPYNEITDIRRVHVSVTNQLNNENALADSSGILFKTFTFDNATGMYVVTISPEELADKGWNINQFYKVQLRFDCYEDEGNSVINYTGSMKNDYLLNYQIYFSEWSSVCLLRPIRKPKVVLRKFEVSQDTIPTYTKGLMPVSGKVYFMTSNDEVDNSETETLQAYTISILDKTTKDVLWKSATTYTGENLNPNDINTTVDLQELDNIEREGYILHLDCVTRNQYKFTKEYEFQIAMYDSTEEFANFNPKIEIIKDDENGYVTVNVTNEKSILGWNIYVRRSSSLDGFSTWETIHSEHINGELKMSIKDTTVSSLVWYKYTLQAENSKGNMSAVYPKNNTDETPNLVLPEFYDAILSRDDKLFRIWYNYQVSSMKPVVNRTKVDTLGGKYPKFAENAVLNYKQFSISGLITAESDVYQEFLKKRAKYSSKGKVNVLRNNYLASKAPDADYTGENNGDYIQEQVRNDVAGYDLNSDNDYPYGSPSNMATSDRFLTTTTNDWMWERDFREELVRWMNDGKPKLYRSMAEGSMVVMLTDIQLTPNNTLGRRIWNFSATMYEIADASSLETLDSLGVYPRKLTASTNTGTVKPGGDVDYSEVVTIGQLYHMTVSDTKENILDRISEELKLKYSGINNDRAPKVMWMKNIKIFFESKPNMFMPLSDGNLDYIEKLEESPYVNSPELFSRIVLGYTFSVQIGGAPTTIFVNQQGYYQIPDSLDVTRISFPQTNDVVTVEYTLVYRENANITNSSSSTQVAQTVVGQETGIFQPDKYIGESLRRKYSYVETNKYYEKMQYWKGICLDVTPMAVANIKYYGDTQFHQYMVGETGVLHMLKDVPVIDLALLGVKMKEANPSRKRFLNGFEYVIDEGTYSSTKEVKNLYTNVVYNIDGHLKIYYSDGEWYDFKILTPELLNGEKDQKWQNTGLAKVPVEGAINYYGSIVRSNYQEAVDA